MLNARLIWVLFIVISASAKAEIYKWVDENGITHFGERIPEAYQAQTENVELTTRQPTQAEREEAERIAEETRQAAGSYKHSKSRRSKPQKFQPRFGSRSAPAKAGAETGKSEKERFLSSQKCFNSYRRENRTIRPEAFQKCQIVK